METKYFFEELGYRRDASESVFFSRQLEHLRAAAFDVEYKGLDAMTFLPMNFSVNPGAEVYTYRVFNKVGKVLVSADYSTASPRADVSGTEVTSKIRGLRNSYGLTIQEARAAALAKMPLSAKKAEAARWLHAKGHDDILLVGNTTAGLTGLFNQTIGDVTEYTILAGAYGDTEWVQAGVGIKTPDEIISDLNAAVHKVVDDSSDVERPDTMILPLSRYNYISATRMGPNAAETILSHFMTNNKYIKTMHSSYKLETASAGSAKRGVCYTNRSDKLEGIIPVEFEQFAPQAKGLEFVTECHSRSGGTVVYYPKSLCYFDEI